MSNNQLQPQTREEIFREKAESYTICYSTSCPLREHCLRAILSRYKPTEPFVTMSINLSNPETQTRQCSMYRNDEPVRMAVGLNGIYHDMPGWLERHIKNSLILAFTRKRYYQYHNGSRPLPPEAEQRVRHLLREHGWNEEPRFAGYVEDYLW